MQNPTNQLIMKNIIALTSEADNDTVKIPCVEGMGTCKFKAKDANGVEGELSIPGMVLKALKVY